MEQVLKAEAHRTIVRVGDTVRRPTYPWSASVHLLLQYLEGIGFAYSPRFLGLDNEGREILSFIDGVCGGDGYVPGVEYGAHAWAMVVPEEGLAAFARLLRDYHDAVGGFVPPSEAPWSIGQGPPRPGEIVCHNDFGPWNVVWREGRPVGIIDWDYAAPGPPTDDVACALEWSVPFCSDEDALKWRRFTRRPDRRQRIKLLAEAYGLSSSDGLVEAVINGQRQFAERVRVLAQRGIPDAMAEVASGYLDEVAARIDWSEAHRSELE